MLLRQLQYAIAVEEHKSFTKAADTGLNSVSRPIYAHIGRATRLTGLLFQRNLVEPE